MLLSLLSALPLSARGEVAGFTKVWSVQDITEYRLDSNGLTVLLLPEHSAPAVTFMVTYRIGSRDESYGTTGATHLLEHLMFKGTARHNKEAGTGFDQLLERTGAETNATTWLDRTNYFETTGPKDLPLVVELEADRMRNLRLREEDRRPEMTVVRNEFERGENTPANALETEIWATAYLAHPYHHNTIGWRSDFEKVPIGKLRAFYDTYYWPDNATVSVIGDFQPEQALALIREKYGAIPKCPHEIPQVYTEEPKQTGPRRLIMRRPGELGVVSIAHKSPPARHADYPAVTVLCDILTNGRNSRYHQALTDKNLTTEVTAMSGFNRDPSLLQISAELTPDTKPEDVEKRLLDEIKSVQDKGVTGTEVASAIARLTAATAFARDGCFAMAEGLNECIAVGDWTMYFSLDDNVRKVTADDVRRVAGTYLLPDQSTTGWFIPKEGGEGQEADGKEKSASKEGDSGQAAAGAEKPAGAGPHARPVPPQEVPESPAVAVAKIAPRIVRTRTAGLDLLVCPTGVKDVVTITGGIPAFDPRERVLTGFLAGMLERGTAGHDASQLAAILDEVGATIEFAAAEGTLDFSARCLKKDLPLVIGLLAEELRTPAFPPDEIEKLRVQLLAEAELNRADTDLQARVAFSQAAFPADHPNRKLLPDEAIEALKKVSQKDLIIFHKEWIGPAAAVMAIVGDADAAFCQAEVGKAFQGWTGGRQHAAVAAAPALADGAVKTVNIPGKESVSVIIGQPSGLRFTDPDALPLSLATAALGSGFTSRLISTVRDTEGLTYGIGAASGQDTWTDGSWVIRTTFAPQLLAQGLASTDREVKLWYESGLTQREFAYRQSAMTGAYRVSLATTGGLAETIVKTVRRGLPLTWLDDYADSITALKLEEVNAALKRHIHPERLVTVRSGTLN
ncbi:MAG: pitrilysin family protein [Verrucomicrobiota bacterium]